MASPKKAVWGVDLGPLGENKNGGVIWGTGIGERVTFAPDHEPYLAAMDGATKVDNRTEETLTFVAPVVRTATDWTSGYWVDSQSRVVRIDTDPETVDRRVTRLIQTAGGDLMVACDHAIEGRELTPEQWADVMDQRGAMVESWRAEHGSFGAQVPDALMSMLRTLRPREV